MPWSSAIDAGILYCQLQRNVILAVFKVRIIVIGFDKLGHFIRIHVVRVNTLFVAGYVLHDIILRLARLVAKDARPLAMRKFTTFGLTHARVAKGRAFEYVSLRALGAFATITAVPEIFAYRCTGQGCRVGILAVGVGAISFGKMHTVGYALGGELMRQVAKVPAHTPAVFQKVLANANLVGVVLISARRAFRTGSYM